MVNKVIYVVVGVIIGIILSHQFCKQKIITKTVTEIKTDTLFVHIIDTIEIAKTEIKHKYLRDTVYIPELGQISLFAASKPFLYGNTYVKGEVLGEVLKMDIYNDFKIPTITNTITNTTTIIKKPSGLFLTAGVGSNFSAPYIGAIFIKDKYLLGLNSGGFQVGYKIR